MLCVLTKHTHAQRDIFGGDGYAWHRPCGDDGIMGVWCMHMQTHQDVHIKCVHFLVSRLHLNKVKILKKKVGPGNRRVSVYQVG